MGSIQERPTATFSRPKSGPVSLTCTLKKSRLNRVGPTGEGSLGSLDGGSCINVAEECLSSGAQLRVADSANRIFPPGALEGT